MGPIKIMFNTVDNFPIDLLFQYDEYIAMHCTPCTNIVTNFNLLVCQAKMFVDLA